MNVVINAIELNGLLLVDIWIWGSINTQKHTKT